MNLKNNTKIEIDGWNYITSMVDIIKNPSLILDERNHILFANTSFENNFQLSVKKTNDKSIFEVGGKQFNIPKLRKLLVEIIPENSFFNDLEIHHTFPFVGEKILLVSAKKVESVVFLTMEDVTITMTVAKTLASFAKTQVEKIAGLEKDIQILKGKKVVL